MTFYSAALTLILVMDPFGNIPVFLSLLQSYDARKRRRIIIREMIIAFGILTLFLFFGKYILAGLHISQPALNISGGVILFLVAIKMIFPQTTANQDTEANGEPMIVPLAVPLVAGPSAMAIVILIATQYPTRMLDWFAALAVAWAVTAIILFTSDYLRRFLGNRGLKAIERLMGMILTTLAVQMLLSGIQTFFSL
ncbi:MAG: MarC family protein [Spirochaetales bacterium]|jgi:multiple antibiotic resistance protein|nr:MarC family protein [Spirochaetales bacterium]